MGILGRAGWFWLGVGLLGCRASDPFGEGPGVPLPAAGAVVAEHPLAVAAGLEILDAGGNAADAAVATALALAVVYPQAGNLGGGGFAVWVPREGRPDSLDFREVAPSGYVPALYLDASGQLVPERSLATPLAVGVPGTPAGLYDLFTAHGSGKLSLSAICAPAIRLASQGFAVDPWLARDLRSGPARARLEADPSASELFYPGGSPLQAGALLVQPRLARTLTQFGRGGKQAFYQGDIAEALVQTLRAADERCGRVAGAQAMTRADLAGYAAVSRIPLVGSFRGYEVISMGPPSSGGLVLLQVLATLDGFPLDTECSRTRVALRDGSDLAACPEGVSARMLHWWIEALRMSFADRAEHLGDPDRVDVPLQELLSADWIARRRISIGERARSDVAAWVAPPPAESQETTHLSVLDRNGNAVSLTTTLNASFGSGILVGEAGFLLNNELDDFSIQPGVPNQYGLVGGEANQLRPNKRPLSSMTPTVVRRGDGAVCLVLGAPGGPRIITAVLQVLMRVLVFDQSIEEAIRAPRIHQQWKPEATDFEEGWPLILVEALRNRHDQDVSIVPGGSFGSVQGIQVLPEGEVRAFSDHRRGGIGVVVGEPQPQPASPLH